MNNQTSMLEGLREKQNRVSIPGERHLQNEEERINKTLKLLSEILLLVTAIASVFFKKTAASIGYLE